MTFCSSHNIKAQVIQTKRRNSYDLEETSRHIFGWNVPINYDFFPKGKHLGTSLFSLFLPYWLISIIFILRRSRWNWNHKIQSRINFCPLSLEAIRFVQITSWLRSSDPQLHVASDGHRNYYKTLITGLTRHNTSSLFAHSHAAELQLQSRQIVRGPLFLSSSDGRLWISDWNCILIQMKHMLPLSELIGKARSFQSGW